MNQKCPQCGYCYACGRGNQTNTYPPYIPGTLIPGVGIPNGSLGGAINVNSAKIDPYLSGSQGSTNH